jgi:death-on-curing protein
LATEQTDYLSYIDAALIHIELMRSAGETRYVVFDRSLIESALARPRQAAVYEDADIIRQAATLCFGLIKSHPWIGGNKRTAIALVDEFLFRNHIEMTSSTKDNIETIFAVESNRWEVDEIESWLRRHTKQIT